MSSSQGLRDTLRAHGGAVDAAMVFAGLDDAAVTAIVEAGIRRLGASTTDVAVEDAALVSGTLGLQRLENLAHAWKLRALAEVRERHAYRTASARSVEEWLSRHGYTRGEAMAQVAASQVLIALPGSAALAYRGGMTMPQLQTAARSLGRGRRAGGAGGAGRGRVRRLDLDEPPGPDEWLDELDRARRDLDALIAEQARQGADRGKLGRELDRFEHDRGGKAIKDRDRTGRARRRAWFATIEGMRQLTVDVYRVVFEKVTGRAR